MGVLPVPDFKRKIAFNSKRGGGTSQIYTVNSDGADLQPVFAKPSYANDTVPKWAPDGNRLVFISDRDVKPRVCMVRAGDPNARVFGESTPVSGCLLDWSPDGTRIIYVHSDRKILHLLDTQTGKVTRLNVALPGMYREFADGCWANDGHIYVTALPIRDATKSEVFRIDPIGLNVEQLTDESDEEASCREFSMTRDGRIAVLRHMVANGPAKGAWMLIEDRSGQWATERITKRDSPIAGYFDLSWFPNGQKIVFSGNSASDSRTHIYALDLATDDVRLLTPGPFADANPDVSVRLPDPPARAD